MEVGRFLSNYIRASDWVNKPDMKATIVSVEVEELGKDDEKEEKLVAYFQELSQGLVLGKTVIGQLVDITGAADTDGWIGKVVVLYYDKTVSFGGKRVGGIRLKAARHGEVHGRRGAEDPIQES